MPRVPTLTAVAVLLCVVGCSKPDLEAEKRAILATDKPWMDAIAAKDVEKAVSFWSEDAVVMPQGQPAVVGKAALRIWAGEMTKIPGFSIKWQTTQVTVAPSGDQAYALATTVTSMTGPDGKTFSIPGKAVTVWRKGADGSWKCVVDIWNDEAPPPPPTPPTPPTPPKP
jgi:ketosteroid isomerase-like protein